MNLLWGIFFLGHEVVNDNLFVGLLHLFKLLLKDAVEEREFEGWSMGFVDTTGMAKSTEGFVQYEEAFNAAIDDKGRVRKVLERFKEGTWRQFVAS